MSTATARVVSGTLTTCLSTEMNSLANNASALSSVGGTSGVFDNSLAATGDGSIVGDVALTLGGALSGAPTAGYGLSIWFIRSVDGGTTFEGYTTGTTASPPLNRAPDVVFNFGGQTTPDSPSVLADIAMPAGKFKVLAWLNGAGVALPATGNVLKILFKSTTVG